MNNRDLDRHITGNYGEDQLKGEAEWEKELDRLLDLREHALKANSGFLIQQAEALLDKHAPDWKEYL